ncbi:MAG TPA: hypothetical protein VN238_04960 [Solirubrobacteraceae bacterium]|nr:hypothetical protein [Solirubrobacteraceae bacterium]
MPVTAKDDWLTNALSSLASKTDPAGDGPQVWLSGDSLHERLLGGPTKASDKPARWSFRACGHHPREWPKPAGAGAGWLPAVYELLRLWATVEFESDAEVDADLLTKEIESIAKAPGWSALRDALGRRAAVVAYRNATSAGTPVAPTAFVLSDPSINGGSVEKKSPSAYAKLVNEWAKPVPGDEPASVKALNKSLNDSFQVWTRSELTKQVAIVDLDVIIWFPKASHTAGAASRFALVELKRQTQSEAQARDWGPYVDDSPNYMLARAATRYQQRPQAGVVDVVVNYFRDQQPPYRCWVHLLSSVSLTEIVGVRHEVSGDTADACALGLLARIDELLGQPFTSRRTRK